MGPNRQEHSLDLMGYYILVCDLETLTLPIKVHSRNTVLIMLCLMHMDGLDASILGYWIMDGDNREHPQYQSKGL